MTGKQSIRSEAKNHNSHFVYGPVPSRRLGLSLGINLVPPKTCTFNCIYCQCGRTTNLTLNRQAYFSIKQIINQVRSVIKTQKVDYLTFSGEGEPTLNKNIGRIILLLKSEFRIPVAVLTNASLLTDKSVRQALYHSDLVVPTLSAIDQRIFNRLHRPHPGLLIKNIIKGLKIFRRYYKGKIWIEVMLVKDVNDQPDHLARLRQVIYELNPDRVHLNTVVRPPAEPSARPVAYDDLVQIQMLFGPGTEIAAFPLSKTQKHFSGVPEDAIIAVIHNRPVTDTDLVQALGIPPSLLRRTILKLIREGKITATSFQGKIFYRPV